MCYVGLLRCSLLDERLTRLTDTVKSVDINCHWLQRYVPLVSQLHDVESPYYDCVLYLQYSISSLTFQFAYCQVDQVSKLRSTSGDKGS